MAKVFLSAGHGGSDPGACAYSMQEKNINLNIMLACKTELERHGVTVVCSRLKDENDAVGDEVKEANASGADLAVSFHTNAGGGNGSESFYWNGDSKGKKLAELCEKHTKIIGQNSRGVKAGNHLWFIKKTNMTAVLCECAFIDNNNDNDIIDTAAEQKIFGVAYAKAILEYLGIAYKAMRPVEPAPTQTVSNYYPKYTGNDYRVDTVLAAIGVPETYRGGYKKRKPIAEANGIANYTGTAAQNTKIIALAKEGKLKKV